LVHQLQQQMKTAQIDQESKPEKHENGKKEYNIRLWIKYISHYQKCWNMSKYIFQGVSPLASGKSSSGSKTKQPHFAGFRNDLANLNPFPLLFLHALLCLHVLVCGKMRQIFAKLTMRFLVSFRNDTTNPFGSRDDKLLDRKENYDSKS
jgi:hypothetical protein